MSRLAEIARMSFMMASSQPEMIDLLSEEQGDLDDEENLPIAHFSSSAASSSSAAGGMFRRGTEAAAGLLRRAPSVNDDDAKQMSAVTPAQIARWCEFKRVNRDGPVAAFYKMVPSEQVCPNCQTPTLYHVHASKMYQCSRCERKWDQERAFQMKRQSLEDAVSASEYQAATTFSNGIDIGEPPAYSDIFTQDGKPRASKATKRKSPAPAAAAAASSSPPLALYIDADYSGASQRRRMD